MKPFRLSNVVIIVNTNRPKGNLADRGLSSNPSVDTLRFMLMIFVAVCRRLAAAPNKKLKKIAGRSQVAEKLDLQPYFSRAVIFHLFH